MTCIIINTVSSKEVNSGYYRLHIRIIICVCTLTVNSEGYYVYVYYVYSICVHVIIASCKHFCIGIPSCPTHVNFDESSLRNNGCRVSLTWQQPPNTLPVTLTTVTYCPTSSSNCGNSMTCTSPCTISGLLNNTEYQFTVIPNNNCGSPTGCTGNTVTHSE